MPSTPEIPLSLTFPQHSEDSIELINLGSNHENHFGYRHVKKVFTEIKDSVKDGIEGEMVYLLILYLNYDVKKQIASDPPGSINEIPSRVILKERIGTIDEVQRATDHVT